ncbi:hypothetical protein PybrP1_007848 [[Pythium] brassicae (nom. inval.)]|nr:hypothetical protein PybrP1_007848 [[Pythium] brassicae (nom. inval.)]
MLPACPLPGTPVRTMIEPLWEFASALEMTTSPLDEVLPFPLLTYTLPPTTSLPDPPFSTTSPPSLKPPPPTSSTEPPTPSSWELDPACTCTAPPSGASPLPTLTKIEPPAPFTASEDMIMISPESLMFDPPDAMKMAPLAPLSPLGPVSITMLPLDAL